MSHGGENGRGAVSLQEILSVRESLGAEAFPARVPVWIRAGCDLGRAYDESVGTGWLT